MVMSSMSDDPVSDEFPDEISLGITNVTLLPATGENVTTWTYIADRNASCGYNMKWKNEAGQKLNDQREFLK